MSDIHADQLIRTRTHLLAPIDRVFEAWTDPDRLREWYPERVSGALRLGGSVTFEWSSLGLELELDVVELEPNRRVAFCGDPGSGPQIQSVELEQTGTGTTMTIEHTGLVTEDEAKGARSGWTLGGAMLAEYLARHFRTERTCLSVLSTTTVDIERVLRAYRQPHWLSPGAPPLDRPRAELSLELGNGMQITGCVLAISERGELLLRCDEIAGVIAFRALATTGLVLYGAQVSAWGPPRPETERLREALVEAVDCLSATLGSALPSA
jgi:uncharacterized protein YndB with AHSA1/START domain